MDANSLWPDRAPAPMLDVIGPYAGKVLDVDDSQDEDGPLGRIKVWVPQLHGEEYEDKPDDIPWARPLGFANPGVGEDEVKRGTFFVPLKNMWTFVFFEGGSIDYPLYLGGWFGKPEGTPEIPEEFLSSDYGAQYPEIPGIVFPPFSLQLHGVKTPQAVTLKWGDDVLIEIDTTPWNNDDPTVAVKIENEDWKLLLQSKGDITIDTEKTLTLKAKELVAEIEEKVEVEVTDGTSVIKTTGDNKLQSESRLVGEAPHATGFENH